MEPLDEEVGLKELPEDEDKEYKAEPDEEQVMKKLAEKELM